ncbi:MULTISPECIES: winged helix-turn-helix transcriptional regulator [unclassified Paenibacillus]|uniref:winged helix-turn-helix transcriptional regulator n=1 Tax=unclassified Paenibacillus TaxID=185978 RepID=UPI00070AADFF|nr:MULTISPECIES: winged helix-turn-helix transcriptional regulator [unclassified Paenibacillus]KQX56658.1 hypothetical protein ASD40_04470 [Paenibacillus sp. Root444D2]KRE35038.1 hypothetical protein ASG85_36210 [Paenibacillus sp. Soil724D2]
MERNLLCPRFEKAVEILSKRWTSLIVFQLLSGPQRFINIDQALPNLSGKVLSERLKELEHEGIVKRVVFPESPVRIEYSLTDKGLALAPIFGEITKWSQEWLPVQE